MSHFMGIAEHPYSGDVEPAEWIDDYYGSHQYGVRFEDWLIVPESELNETVDNHEVSDE